MRIIEKFKVWWASPITPKMRWQSVFIAMFGGFWLSFLGILAWVSYFYPHDGIELMILFKYVGCGMLVFMVLGYRFPKVILLVTFPFSMWGISS